MSQKNIHLINELVTRAIEAEQNIYRWCTGEARGSLSAQTLAKIYVSICLDQVRLIRFSDLRVLDDIRLEWALTLMRAYVEGAVTVPWDKVIDLMTLYDLCLVPESMTNNYAEANLPVDVSDPSCW